MNPGAALPFERLELIDDPTPCVGALNMALDEMLLDGLGDCPLLRLYRWAGPAVSLGYFEPVAAVQQRWPGYDTVRRWSGGGVVEHGADLTFSLLVPRALALATLPAAESYRRIHEAVGDAFARAGSPDVVLQKATVAKTAGSRACFENPVAHDLLLAGDKIAGGAQRRTRRGLLHQGSILLSSGPDGSSLGRKLAAVLPGAFGACVEPRALRPVEIDAARSLAATKYGTDAWLHRF